MFWYLSKHNDNSYFVVIKNIEHYATYIFLLLYNYITIIVQNYKYLTCIAKPHKIPHKLFLVVLTEIQNSKIILNTIFLSTFKVQILMK